jgi:hypothetical protein
MALGVIGEFHLDHLPVVDDDPVVDARDQLGALRLPSSSPRLLQVAQEADDGVDVGERRRGGPWWCQGIEMERRSIRMAWSTALPKSLRRADRLMILGPFASAEATASQALATLPAPIWAEKVIVF